MKPAHELLASAAFAVVAEMEGAEAAFWEASLEVVRSRPSVAIRAILWWKASGRTFGKDRRGAMGRVLQLLNPVLKVMHARAGSPDEPPPAWDAAAEGESLSLADYAAERSSGVTEGLLRWQDSQEVEVPPGAVPVTVRTDAKGHLVLSYLTEKVAHVWLVEMTREGDEAGLPGEHLGIVTHPETGERLAVRVRWA